MSLTAKRRFPREEAQPVVDWLTSIFNQFKIKFEICGSWRRGKEDIGDLDIIVQLPIASDGEPDLHRIEKLKENLKDAAQEVLVSGPQTSRYVFENIQVDLKIFKEEVWHSAMLHYTGPQIENIRLRKRAKQKGFKLSEYGFKNRETGNVILVSSEKEIYERLGLKYKEPKDRK